MKQLLYTIGLISILFSCGNKEQPATLKESNTIEKTDETENSTKKIDPNIQGRKELRLFEGKYEAKWDEQPQTFPYSNGKIYKVFKLNCSGECFKSEFTERESSGVEISKNDFDAFIDLLKSPKSYGNSTAFCHYPKFGLIVYDSDSIPTEFSTICLDCNNSRTYPGQIEVDYENKLLYGFSKEARKTLRNMFFKWGIDYYGYSSSWDDEKEYQFYLEKKNSLTKDIK